MFFFLSNSFAFLCTLSEIGVQESRRAVLALQGMGLDVWIVTGDNRRVAEVVGRRLGIAPQRIMSEVLPAQKARKVRKTNDLKFCGGFVVILFWGDRAVVPMII